MNGKPLFNKAAICFLAGVATVGGIETYGKDSQDESYATEIQQKRTDDPKRGIVPKSPSDENADHMLALIKECAAC